MERFFSSYINDLARILQNVETTGAGGSPVGRGEALSASLGKARAAHDRGNKLIFIGNGGSAGIASHVAIDYSKNGNLRALALNDPAALTCLSNDLGYAKVFAKQIEMYGAAGDVLVAISSGGKSPNILEGVAAARRQRCEVITLSGFAPENPLRRLGDINFYLNSMSYGFVELGHLAIIHSILDFAMSEAPEAVQV